MSLADLAKSLSARTDRELEDAFIAATDRASKARACDPDALRREYELIDSIAWVQRNRHRDDPLRRYTYLEPLGRLLIV
jgi:hypothetical protein